MRVFIITALCCIFSILSLTGQSTTDRALQQQKAIELYAEVHNLNVEDIKPEVILATSEESLSQWEAVANAYKNEEDVDLSFVQDVVDGMQMKLNN